MFGDTRTGESDPYFDHLAGVAVYSENDPQIKIVIRLFVPLVGSLEN